MIRLFILASLLIAFLFQACRTGSEVHQNELLSADRHRVETSFAGPAARLNEIKLQDPFRGLAPVYGRSGEGYFAALGLHESDVSPREAELIYADAEELSILTEAIDFETSLRGRIIVFDNYGARYAAWAGAPRILAHMPTDMAFEIMAEMGCHLNEGERIELGCDQGEDAKRALSRLFREGRRQVVLELEGLRDLGDDLVYRLAATEKRAAYLMPALEELSPRAIPAEIKAMAETSPEFAEARAIAAKMSGLSELDELFAITRFATDAAEYYAIAYDASCGDERDDTFSLYQHGARASRVHLPHSIGGVAMLFEARDRGELLGVGYSLGEGLFSLFRVGDELVKPAFAFDGDPCRC